MNSDVAECRVDVLPAAAPAFPIKLRRGATSGVRRTRANGGYVSWNLSGHNNRASVNHACCQSTLQTCLFSV